MPIIPKLPAPFATFLLRIPLAVLFVQQGFDKLPVDIETAEVYGLSLLVWFFVVYGEISAGVGLLVGGLAGLWWRRGIISYIADMLTRFSGITMTCIVTGVIWLSMPDSILEVIIYDYMHVSLYVGGLYFALRGNAKF
jgi:putative oxidoreductase